MKEFQRVISFLLAFVMVVGLVPSIAVSAEETEPVTVVEETAAPAAEETSAEVFEATETLEVASVEPADGVITADISEDVSVTAIEITAADGVDCITPGETLQLTATVLPENATNQNVIWSSQDESVLTVDENGLVTGIAGGCTFVEVAATDGSEVEIQFEIAVFDETTMLELELFTEPTYQPANAQTYEGLTFPVWANDNSRYIDGHYMMSYGYLGSLQSTNDASIQWTKYGTNVKGTHHGTEYYALDISGTYAGYGAVVHAVADGRVVNYRPNYGQITIEHSGLTLLDGTEIGTWYSTYVHMQKGAILEYIPELAKYNAENNVVKDDNIFVDAGQKIGKVGSTNTDPNAPHLHFSMTTKTRNYGSFHWSDSASGFSNETDKANAVLEYANATINPCWIYSGLTKEDIVVLNEKNVRITSTNDSNANPADIEAWTRFDLTYGSNSGANGGGQESTYVFAFNSGINGSTGSMSSLSVTPGKTFTMPQNGFSYTGFEVAGWNLKRSDGLWLTNGDTFATEEDATTLGYYTFHSGYQYTFEEDWVTGEDCSFTFYPIWQQSESDAETEEGLRTELANGKTQIKLEGSVTLDKDLVIPEGTTLTIAAGCTLNVPQGIKLTNNGTIDVGEKYTSSKSFLKVKGTCENNGDISVLNGGLENSGALSNNGDLSAYGTSDGQAVVFNYGTVTNSGNITISGEQDGTLDAQFSGGTYSQTEQGSFTQEYGYVTGVQAADIQLTAKARNTAEIQELLSAGYKSLQIHVVNDLTLSQNITIPKGVSLFFEGDTLTIPEGIRFTIDGAYPCELSTESNNTTVNVQGELYCDGDYGWVDMWDGTMNVSGKLAVNNCLRQGKLNILDGGTLTNNGLINNYGQPADLTMSDMAILMNNGYIAGENEKGNSTDVSVTGTSYSYDGRPDLPLSEAAEILENHGIETDEVFVIWQAGLLRPEDGEEATITVNNYEGTWYLLGYGSHGNGWGLAGICYESTYDLWFGDRWLYDYAVVLVNNGADTPSEDTEIWIEEDFSLTEDWCIAEETSVYIAEGVTVTVPSGIELNIQGYMEVYGNLIFEEGSILTITDARYQRLCIWTGKLDVTEADISGVPYGAVELQLNSPAEVYGIPDEMLYASIYVYNTSDINAALAQASNYEILLMMVDTSFTLTNSITIPENAEWYLWKWYSDELDNPSITIPAGVTVTNNGWLTILEQARMVFEPGSTLINNGYAYADRFGAMLIHGTLENNGTIEESIYAETVSQEYLEGCIADAKSFERDWLHECKTTLTSDMTIDLGENEFSMSQYGSLIVPNGVTLTLNSSVCTYTYDYGDLEIGNITVENGGKLIINDYLTTSDDAGNDLILEDGAYLEVNGWLLANGNIKIGKNAVVKVNGYWVGRAPINNGGTILPAVKEISVSADNSRVDVDAAEYITLQVSIDSRTEENLIPGAIAGATWTSSNPDIIDPKQIVDFGEGKYRAYLGGKTGTVTLTATSIDGSGKTASITLEVIGQGGCGGNHSEVIDEAVPATCTQNGLTEGRHCALCGEVLVAQSVVKATGHSYTDGKCVNCGQEEPQVGDSNGDGGIDTQDAVHLLWYTLFPEKYPLASNGDVTGDGKVTVEDAVYVIWYTLFPGMYPLK